MTEAGCERKQRREAAAQADAADTPVALQLCRAIRDDQGARDADRLMAIRLIMQLKGQTKK